MSTNATLRLLAWHAGLEGHDALDPASVSGATATATDASDAVRSFLGVLSRFSVDLNGVQPSAVIGGAPQAVDRGAAYSVSEVERMPREAGHDEEAQEVETCVERGVGR
jgi:hypothetical protein